MTGLDERDADLLARSIAVGGIALFPADTVYGLACEPQTRQAVNRLYALKRRSVAQPSAVMFFSVELAEAALPELGPRTREALRRLLPGGVTLLLANPARRFELACGEDPTTLGVRVPALEGPLAALAGLSWPVLQSSANRSGEPDARRVQDVSPAIRDGVDVVLDAGPLPGTPSTLVDLRRYEETGEWDLGRVGAVAPAAVAAALGP